MVKSLDGDATGWVQVSGLPRVAATHQCFSAPSGDDHGAWSRALQSVITRINTDQREVRTRDRVCPCLCQAGSSLGSRIQDPGSSPAVQAPGSCEACDPRRTQRPMSQVSCPVTKTVSLEKQLTRKAVLPQGLCVRDDFLSESHRTMM